MPTSAETATYAPGERTPLNHSVINPSATKAWSVCVTRSTLRRGYRSAIAPP